MATEAQLLANRNNAQKSTGPRTSEGKAIVSQNAVKHGLFSRRTIIHSENQADFDLYRDQMLTDLAPESPMQSMLAERIITLSWRLIRLNHIQNQTIDVLSTNNENTNPLVKLTQSILSKHLGHLQTPPHLPNSPNPETAPATDITLGRMAIKDFSSARILDRLLMYERRMEHSLYRTILEFQKLQIIKKLKSDSEMKIKELTL
jgi:hypothetical protein